MAALPDSFEVTLDEVKQENPDTATLYFRAPPAHREYRAGQYASIAPQQFEALAGLQTSLEAEKGKREMPRTVNFITGPSRSADIEQTLLLGAHGPRRLHIVVVRCEAPDPR